MINISPPNSTSGHSLHHGTSHITQFFMTTNALGGHTAYRYQMIHGTAMWTGMQGWMVPTLRSLGVPKIQRVLISCSKIFNTMVRLLEWASLLLKMPNNSDFPLLKDWEDFRKKKCIQETQCIVKHFVMCAADL